MKDNLIADKSFNFSVKIIKIYKKTTETYRE